MAPEVHEGSYTNKARLSLLLSLSLLVLLLVISSSSSSCCRRSSSTQRSARRPVDEMYVVQKKVFSPRPEATFQVNFNAKTHLFNLKCKKQKMAVA